MRRKTRHRPASLAAMVAFAASLSLAVPLAGAHGGRSRFEGKTAQGYAISLAAAGPHVYLVRVKVKLRCHDGGLLYDDLSDFEAAQLRSNGRFNDLQFGPTDEVHWRGKLSGDKIHGSIRVQDHLKNGVRCDSGNVGLAAHEIR